MNNQEQEGVFTVYDKETNELKAIIKRDNISKKNIVYMCKEANSEDIFNLIIKNNG